MLYVTYLVCQSFLTLHFLHSFATIGRYCPCLIFMLYLGKTLYIGSTLTSASMSEKDAAFWWKLCIILFSINKDS